MALLLHVLRAQLPQRLAPQGRVQVATVDGMQGSEAAHVVLSAVRSSAAGGIGFVRDPRRLCVAISRARLRLGSTHSLRSERGYCQYSARYIVLGASTCFVVCVDGGNTASLFPLSSQVACLLMLSRWGTRTYHIYRGLRSRGTSVYMLMYTRSTTMYFCYCY